MILDHDLETISPSLPLQMSSACYTRNYSLLLFSIFFRFLATGDSFASLSLRFRMGKSTVAAIVKDTCSKIWEVLHEEYIPQPTTQMWYDVAKRYSSKWNFPNCIGSIDGKHIEVKCPPNSGSLYYNYKQYFSIVLQAVADADCKLIAVDVGTAGRQSDGGTFRTSSLFQKLEAGMLNVPQDMELPDTPFKVPCVLVGDEAYPLLPYLMRPFPRRNLNDMQLVFNYRLSRARRCVECAFGIMSAKWRILHKYIETNTDVAISIVNSICVLHNFVITEEGIDPHFMSISTSTTDTARSKESRSHYRFSNSAKQVREMLMHYFSGPGSVAWQNNYALPENIVQQNAEVNNAGPDTD